jgi:hypothetical protein
MVRIQFAFQIRVWQTRSSLSSESPKMRRSTRIDRQRREAAHAANREGRGRACAVDHRGGARARGPLTMMTTTQQPARRTSATVGKEQQNGGARLRHDAWRSGRSNSADELGEWGKATAWYESHRTSIQQRKKCNCATSDRVQVLGPCFVAEGPAERKQLWLKLLDRNAEGTIHEASVL